MKFDGIYAAMLTPFGPSGHFDEVAAEGLIEYLLNAGVDGLYITGTTGEGLLMTLEERQRFAEAVVRFTAGRAKVIVHVGTNATDEAVTLAKHAAEAGADAVSTLPPLFFRVDEDAVFEHYSRVAAAGCPLIAYHLPSLTGQRMTPELIRRLIELPGFVGVKYSDCDFYAMRHLIDETNGRCSFLNGSDEVLLCGLLMGAGGGIGSTYNVMPEAFVQLYRAFRAGDISQAQDLQFRIDRCVREILRYSLQGSMKAILAARGFPVGDPRRPLPSVPTEVGRRLSAEIERLLSL